MTNMLNKLSKQNLIRAVIIAIFALIAILFLSSAQALVVGIIIALTVGHPFGAQLKSTTQKLLAIAIVGLGFGMDLPSVASVGVSGFGYTLIGLLFTFAFSVLLSRMCKTTHNTSLLLSAGTGVCGGSAIAALAPVIKARHEEIAVALAIVFSLNALALVIFPPLGTYFSLSQEQFGLWCALAIHDTSSVVGATLHYGQRALEIGTTVKLSRALWIMPLAIVFSLIHRDDKKASIKLPWFIVGFLLASAVVTLVPVLKPMSVTLVSMSKHLMVLNLFLIGLGLTKDNLRAIGPAPFVHGVLLWIAVSVLSLVAIFYGVIGGF